MHSANLGQIVDLAERSAGSGIKSQLNPDWVEELMGYPRGWTDLDRDEPGIWMGWPARPGEPQFPYEHPRTVTGMKDRAKRLKALGNAVVPQQAEPIFRTVQLIDYMIWVDDREESCCGLTYQARRQVANREKNRREREEFRKRYREKWGL